jgi:hypothetical protein
MKRAKPESSLESSKAYLRVYALLIRAAQQKGFVTSSDVAEVMARSGESSATRTTNQLLDSIAKREHRSGRPVLPSVVVSATEHQPMAAVLKSASELGLLPAGASKERRVEFWREEVNRVFDEWADG